MTKLLLIVSVSFALVACGGSSEPQGVTEPVSSTPTPSPSPCIDDQALLEHRDNVTDEMDKVLEALDDFDAVAAAEHVRIAASETRALADEVAEVDPEIEAHFLRAGDALDEAATSWNGGDLPGGSSWIGQGTNEIEQAVGALDVSTYC